MPANAPAAENLQALQRRIADSARAAGRDPSTIQLLAVSKRQSADAVRALATTGQRAFGENYVQEALGKQAALGDLALDWHFIGRLQRNKTREVAARFAWVHTVDRLDLAERLSRQRPAELAPLNVLLEVNVSGEDTKGGIPPVAVPALAEAVRPLPGLVLRGLMCLPEPTPDIARQRAAFRLLRETLAALPGPPLDTLSMGTTGDFEAAIAEGATIVRIGTALFGARD